MAWKTNTWSGKLDEILLDFHKILCFELTKEEQGSLRSHFGTLKRGTHAKYLSYAFTQEGIAMLSGILRSERAIQVNVEIMRAFIRMRQLLASQKGLMQKILAMEKKYDEKFKLVFKAIYQLMEEEEKPKHQIGFKTDKKDKWSHFTLCLFCEISWFCWGFLLFKNQSVS